MSRRDKKEVGYNDISSRVERNSKEMDILVNTIVDKFCKPLDDYVESVSKLLSDNDRKHIPDEKLDSIVLNLPTLLYFASTAQESLGIREDMAKSIRNELFNRVRENAKVLNQIHPNDVVFHLLCLQGESLHCSDQRHSLKELI